MIKPKHKYSFASMRQGLFEMVYSSKCFAVYDDAARIYCSKSPGYEVYYKDYRIATKKSFTRALAVVHDQVPF